MKKRVFVSAAAIVAVCAVFVCMFMTDKAEFKSPDGKITAVFSEFDKTLTFHGKGEISGSYDWIEKDPDYEKKTAKAVDMESIKRIVFEPGITSIANGEFCSPTGIFMVVDYHTVNCPNLKEVIFKGDIDKIGTFNFYGYKKLKKVIFEGSCKSIDALAFSNNPNLKTVNIPNGCTVNDRAFHGGVRKLEYESDALKSLKDVKIIFVMDRCSNYD